jgi:galactose mutarotase-like enzyme
MQETEYTLSNQILKVVINAKGAELQSIIHSGTKLEYMWNADPNFWAKKSPVLFPIVGGLKNNSYTYQGQTYSLGRHGFARERMFTVTDQSVSSITFTLEADEETLSVYPFLFRFSVIYTLENDTISVSYLVENKGATEMFFSVGAHPAFTVPLVNGTSYDDHYLQFNENENTGRWPLSSEGLIKKAPTSLLENKNVLPMTKALFFGDALVFKGLRSNSISILNHKNPHGLNFVYEDFPYMGIWAFKNADFVCIEPWCGIADSVDTTGDLTEKEGINKLLPDTSFLRTWSVTLF